MTDSEFPDPLRGLFGETDGESRSALAPVSGVPGSSSVATGAGFSSRREMREAGGYRAAEAPVAVRDRSRDKPTRSRGKATVRVKATRSRGRDAMRADLATKPARKSWRRKLSSAGVMAVVVGLFASLTLPAFAQQDSLALTADPLAGQTVEVTAATTDESLFIRDNYGVTNAADLRRLYADAIRQQNLAAYMNSGARALGDDYPWPDQLSRPQGGGLSPLNYYYRECVDFVAWRLNRDAGTTSAPFRWVWSNLTPGYGSAYAWKQAWINHGWEHGPTPRVGAVAWFPGANHVAYVSGILADGSVVLEEYNWGQNHAYNQRIIPASGAYYLYAPPA